MDQTPSDPPPAGPQTAPERRERPDRRRRPTRPWDALLTPARRAHARRPGDAGPSGLVDRHDGAAALMVVALLILTILDGLLTIVLVDRHCEEANPIMAYFIERGTMHFILGKYALTAAGVPVLLAYKDHRMFRTRFRVGYLIPAFVGLYLALLAYQVALLRSPRSASMAAGAAIVGDLLRGGNP